MKIHEHQAKTILNDYGIAIPRGFVTQSADEAVSIYKKLDKHHVMVKAQILSGGRGKAGGIIKCSSSDETKIACRKLLGNKLSTFQSGAAEEIVKSVLIQECFPIQDEMYLGAAVNKSEGLPNLIFSKSGGIDVEENAKNRAIEIVRAPFNPFDKIDSLFFFQSLNNSGFTPEALQNLCVISAKLARAFIDRDCSLIEINPLTQNGNNFVAIDAKIVFDDNALFRHPEYEALRDPNEDDYREKRAKKSGLSYVSLNGNIGCLVNGAGLAMATMDMISEAGGLPANFLDVGGSADKDQVIEGLRIILEDTNVSGILVNIFGGIMRCDIIAQALVDAADIINIKLPVVARLEGTMSSEGREILKKSRIKLYVTDSLREAAKKIIELTKKRID
jgi:succinyl-CoA synthetase beta subunit